MMPTIGIYLGDAERPQTMQVVPTMLPKIRETLCEIPKIATKACHLAIVPVLEPVGQAR